MVTPTQVREITIGDLPKPVKEHLESLRNRVEELKRIYKDLRFSGRPLWESILDIAVIKYTVDNGISQRTLAIFLGIHENSIYNVIKAIEKGEIAIYNKEKRITEKIFVREDDLKKLIDELIKKPSMTKVFTSIMDLDVVKEFISNPEKIQKTSKHSRFYTQSQIRDTLKALKDVVDYIKRNEDKLREIFKDIEIVENPDLWTDQHEKIVSYAIDSICLEKYSDQAKQRRCKSSYRKFLKRIKKFRNWFRGEIGKAITHVLPLDPNATLFLSDLRELKYIYDNANDDEAFRKAVIRVFDKHNIDVDEDERKRRLLSLAHMKLNEYKALFDIMLIHIWSGSREGYSSIKFKIERLKAEKRDIEPDYSIESDFVDTSLVGIKWNKAIIQESKITGFEIFEEKTKETWILNIPWIYWIIPEFESRIQEYYRYAKKNNIKSVIKTILNYHGINNIETIIQFERWYNRMINCVRYILNKPESLTPHKLRSSHIAILSELGLHLEYAILNLGFGVGWSDLATARAFYMRISKEYLQRMIEVVRENASRIKL